MEAVVQAEKKKKKRLHLSRHAAQVVDGDGGGGRETDLGKLRS